MICILKVKADRALFRFALFLFRIVTDNLIKISVFRSSAKAVYAEAFTASEKLFVRVFIFIIKFLINAT